MSSSPAGVVVTAPARLLGPLALPPRPSPTDRPTNTRRTLDDKPPTTSSTTKFPRRPPPARDRLDEVKHSSVFGRGPLKGPLCFLTFCPKVAHAALLSSPCRIHYLCTPAEDLSTTCSGSVRLSNAKSVLPEAPSSSCHDLFFFYRFFKGPSLRYRK